MENKQKKVILFCAGIIICVGLMLYFALFANPAM